MPPPSEPNAGAITQESQDSDERDKFDPHIELLSKSGFKTTAQYETEMKGRFIEEPANLKRLIVVSKLPAGLVQPSVRQVERPDSSSSVERIRSST